MLAGVAAEMEQAGQWYDTRVARRAREAAMRAAMTSGGVEEEVEGEGEGEEVGLERASEPVLLVQGSLLLAWRGSGAAGLAAAAAAGAGVWADEDARQLSGRRSWRWGWGCGDGCAGPLPVGDRAAGVPLWRGRAQAPAGPQGVCVPAAVAAAAAEAAAAFVGVKNGEAA